VGGGRENPSPMKRGTVTRNLREKKKLGNREVRYVRKPKRGGVRSKGLGEKEEVRERVVLCITKKEAKALGGTS